MPALSVVRNEKNVRSFKAGGFTQHIILRNFDTPLVKELLFVSRALLLFQ